MSSRKSSTGAATAGFPELPGAHFVRSQFKHFPEATFQAFEQFAVEAIAGGRQGVKGPSAVVARDDQFSSTQISKMTGSGGLGNLDDADEVANAQFLFEKQV